jgi:hypothetical protein
MNKKIIILSAIVVLIIIGFMIYKYDAYILTWQANEKINVDGIKLMASEDEVRRILGTEEEYMPGFGGYRLEYISKGIKLDFLSDSDTDFYKKVNRIEITNPNYDIYGVKVGDGFDEALNTIQKQGFTKIRDGYSGYWKRSMYIELDYRDNVVQKITIGIQDRVSSKRIY